MCRGDADARRGDGEATGEPNVGMGDSMRGDAGHRSGANVGVGIEWVTTTRVASEAIHMACTNCAHTCKGRFELRVGVRRRERGEG